MNTNIRMALGAIVGASILGMVMTNTMTLRGQLIGTPSTNDANSTFLLPWLNVSSTPSVLPQEPVMPSADATSTISVPNLGSTSQIPTPALNTVGTTPNNPGNTPDITGTFSTDVSTINPTIPPSQGQSATDQPQPMPTPMCEVSGQQVSEVTNLIAVIGQTIASLELQKAQLQDSLSSLMATSSSETAAIQDDPFCEYLGLGC